MRYPGLFAVLCLLLTFLPSACSAADKADRLRKAGDRAPDFTALSSSGETVRLSGLLKQGPVVLVMLRGFS